MRMFATALLAFTLATAGACGPVSSDSDDYWIDDAGQVHEKDAPTHCDDQHPQDCDYDGDGFTPAQGDCNDHDGALFPGAAECNANGNGDQKDNNCNGRVDEGCQDTDEDGDGYTIAQGDCNDQDALINPGAYEVTGNGKDDNCDGRVDEVVDCDCGTLDPNDVQSYVNAIELCASQVENPALNGDSRGRGIFAGFGPYSPKGGCNFVILSTGIAGSKSPQDGTRLSQTPYNFNPADYPDNPNQQYEPSQVWDYGEFKLTIKVPTNAHSFSFDFVYLTSEYPEYSCTQYNDTFVAMLQSEAYEGNISFDSAHNTIQVNSALFLETDPTQLQGSGYDTVSTDCRSLGGRPNCTMPQVGSSCVTGGSTGWLTTTSPVVPGEVIDLTFAVFDEGDNILDSMVAIDNFRWEVEGSSGPCTDPDGC